MAYRWELELLIRKLSPEEHRAFCVEWKERRVRELRRAIVYVASIITFAAASFSLADRLRGPDFLKDEKLGASSFFFSLGILLICLVPWLGWRAFRMWLLKLPEKPKLEEIRVKQKHK